MLNILNVFINISKPDIYMHYKIPQQKRHYVKEKKLVFQIKQRLYRLLVNVWLVCIPYRMNEHTYLNTSEYTYDNVTQLRALTDQNLRAS